MLVAMVFETLGIAAIFPIINYFTENQSSFIFLDNFLIQQGFVKEDFILIFISIIFLIYLVKNIYLAFYYWLENNFAYQTRFDLGVRLYKKYLNSPYIFHVENHSSKLITKIVQETALFGSSIMSLSTLITELLIVFGITGLLFIVRPFETFFIVLIILFLSLFFYLITRKITFKLGNLLVLTQKLKMKVLNESLNSIKDIIMFKAKDYFIKDFNTKSNEVASLGYKMSFINKLPRIWFEMAAIAIISFIILYSSLQNYAALNILGTLGVFLLSSLKIIPSINKILISIQTIKYSETAIKSLSKDIKDIDKIKSIALNEKVQFNFKKNILFKNVQFSYKSNKQPILKNINFEIKQKDFVAFVGKTGSGKSTLLNLLMGLLEASSGQILVDGVDIKKNLIEWRKNLGYVSQNINLLDDSIKKNIAYGFDETKISNQRLSESALRAQLSNFINQNEKKYDLIVGEDGIKISGGQKQRIAIARALYNDPSILVLDEPTSSLDSNTEKEIFSSLKQLNEQKTIIVVSHNIRDYQDFNKVFEIKNQEIIKIK